MKKTEILLAAITTLTLLFSCNSSVPNNTPGASLSSVDSKTTWSLSEIWRTDTLMTTCESVLYDQSRKLLFVSCINGAPQEKNGLGYISLLNPDGTIKNLHWVDKLNAPKGMGIFNGLLYVTDIDQLVVIDIHKAEVIKKLDLEGASFLNDVAIGSDGSVYISDSDTGYIWIYRNGKPEVWITEGLERPNGLYIEEERILLTSSGSSDLKIIDRLTRTSETVTNEIGHGDGVEFTGSSGYYLTSSWSGEIFIIAPDFTKVSLLKTSDQEINSADLGFNIADQVVYVPTFFDNRVVAYKLEKSQEP